MPRLLIVDDNESIHQDFKKVLVAGYSNKLRNVEMELFGAEDPEPVQDMPPVNYNISYAYQGEDAIEMVDRAATDGAPYAVVFMDVRMPPGMDGIKAAAEIWKRHPDTEMVICSAHSDYSWNDMLKEIGISDKLQFLRKPFDMVTVQQLALSCSKKWELEQTTKKYIKQLEIENREKEDAQARLAHLNDELESRIKSRTSELEKTNSNLKNALTHLEDAQEQLLAAEKMASLGGLIAGVAQEIREPVNEGTAFAAQLARETKAIQDQLQMGDVPEEDLVRHLQSTTHMAKQIMASFSHTVELIDQFQRTAVSEEEGLRKFKALKYLKEIMASFQPRLKRTRIKTDIQGDASLELLGYPQTLARIINHFVMNSLTHGYDSGEQGHLFIRLISQGDAFILTYADDGKGIAPEHCRQIFDPLFVTEGGRSGAARGLHLVHNLVTQDLKGHITCNSQLGRGSMFTIKAPMKLSE